MHRPSRLLLPLAVALALVGLAGCGGARTYPVTGKVVFKDGADVSPLAGGLVVFEPVEGGGRDAARGEIRQDGSFRLGTHSEGDGVAPGRYRALVSAPTPPPAPKMPRIKPLIDARYQDLQQSPLEFTVEPRSNDFTLTVERPARRPGAGGR